MRPIDADKTPYVEAVKDTLEPSGKFYARREDIRALPTIEPEQHWIPCSERLPDKTGRYLVTCSKIGAWETDWNIFFAETKLGWLYENRVIAWMPLPEPYKEGQE